MSIHSKFAVIVMVPYRFMDAVSRIVDTCRDVGYGKGKCFQRLLLAHIFLVILLCLNAFPFPFGRLFPKKTLTLTSQCQQNYRE